MINRNILHTNEGLANKFTATYHAFEAKVELMRRIIDVKKRVTMAQKKEWKTVCEKDLEEFRVEMQRCINETYAYMTE